MAEGATGVAVLAATVVMLAGFEAKFEATNINGPPTELAVIFCNAKVAGLGALV